MDILIRSALVQDDQPPLDIGIREGMIYKLAPRIDDPVLCKYPNCLKLLMERGRLAFDDWGCPGEQ
jgi:hypothetical protein